MTAPTQKKRVSFAVQIAAIHVERGDQPALVTLVEAPNLDEWRPCQPPVDLHSGERFDLVVPESEVAFFAARLGKVVRLVVEDT